MTNTFYTILVQSNLSKKIFIINFSREHLILKGTLFVSFSFYTFLRAHAIVDLSKLLMISRSCVNPGNQYHAALAFQIPGSSKKGFQK